MTKARFSPFTPAPFCERAMARSASRSTIGMRQHAQTAP